MYKLIKDYPNYRIHPVKGIETCVERGSNRPTNVWRPLKQVFDKSCGYFIVTLCKDGVCKNKRVHRLLCESFIPNPENKKHVNHKNGIKVDNSLPNLEWATPSENAKHACDTGLCDARRKAQEVAVVQYSKEGHLIKEHCSLHEAARNTNTAYQNIFKVCNGKRKSAGGYVWVYKKRSETIEKQSTD